MGFNLASAPLMPYGLKTGFDFSHRFLSKMVYFSVSLPLLPKGFVSFISGLYLSSKKYLVRRNVWLMHCRALFMKQVLPRFDSPVRPKRELSVI